MIVRWSRPSPRIVGPPSCPGASGSSSDAKEGIRTRSGATETAGRGSVSGYIHASSRLEQAGNDDTRSRAKRRLERSQIIPALLNIAAVCGFLLVVYLIIDSGAAQVAHAMAVIGWWLIPITLFHVVPLALSALSWRELLPAATRPHAIAIIWMRWIRESINSLLPVASIGGD